MEGTRRPETETGRIRSILDLVPVGVLRLAPTGEILYANLAAAQSLSMPTEEIEKRQATENTWGVAWEDGSADDITPAWILETLQSGVPVRNAVHSIFTDDPEKTRWVLVNMEPMVDADGVVAEVVLTFQDITERKREAIRTEQLQEQLLQSQKIEAVGRLAGGVAHDFNNLLTCITGNISLLQNGDSEPTKAGESLAEAADAARRAADLTRQLLAFSRKQHIEPRRLDLAELVEGLGRMLQRLIGEHIVLEIEKQGGSCCVMADPGQLEQVIVNLVVNARDAMPSGGRLSIHVGAEEAIEDPEETGEFLDPDEYLVLTIQDTGVGIPRENLDRLFEPFYTTKPQGEGTGLGLSTAYGIIKQHGGKITVASEPGAGTSFTILLPRTTEDDTEELRTVKPDALPGGGETILVVEDEELVRRIIERILGRLGYRLLLASQGSQALELSRNHTEPIDLLLTDVVMPGMSGYELAEAIRKERQDIAVLFSSGYSEEDIFRYTSLEEREVHFLSKPYSPKDLAGAVRKALDDS